MTGTDLRIMLTELVILSLRNPRQAAEQIIGWRLDRETLWTALALAAAVNTMIFSFSIMLQPTPGMPAFFTSPLAMFVLLAGVLVITTHGLYWTGRAIGGQGDLGDMLALVVFLQVLRILAQLVIFVLMFVAPGISVIFSLATGIVGLWILVNFIAAAFRFPTLGRAFGTLLIAMLMIVLGLSFLLSIVGIAAQGVV
ncbi:Yip1 family protein [Sulfitobacter sp.]|uniref:Yip1 family protein n=1 Tax=Sulfitobacter sp. TaxID=1903071 RepID=UPI003564E0CA